MKVELIDELLKGCTTQEDVFGENGIFKELVKAISERALQSELTTHLGYKKHEIKGKNSGNSRNGASTKTVKGEFGETEISVPRDRAGTFEPRFIPKGERLTIGEIYHLNIKSGIRFAVDSNKSFFPISFNTDRQNNMIAIAVRCSDSNNWNGRDNFWRSWGSNYGANCSFN